MNAYLWTLALMVGFLAGYIVGHSSGVSVGRDQQRAAQDNAWAQAREMKLCEFEAKIYQAIKCGNKP